MATDLKDLLKMSNISDIRLHFSNFHIV